MSDNSVIELGLAGNYTGIENRLVEVDFELPDLSPVKVHGRFFYLSFQGKEPSVNAFVDFLYPKIIAFCIPRSKRLRNMQLFKETGDDRYHLELSDQAKNLFIRAAKSLPRGGEPGELILFAVLEAFFDAPQIACKMYLKTSENMPVHGADAIHAKHDSKTDSLILYWGESKLYEQLSSALDAICTSVSDFVTKNAGRSKKDRDIDIIKDHVDIQDEASRTAFLDFFDPYTPRSNAITEVHCCMAGFDYSLYKALGHINEEEVEAHFQEQYRDRISSACTLLRDKIIENDISDLTFSFVLLPFKSVAEFRTLFYQKLGLDPGTIAKIEEGAS